jgi:hypothetical protein
MWIGGKVLRWIHGFATIMKPRIVELFIHGGGRGN